jgi:HK97 family phage portal protein
VRNPFRRPESRNLMIDWGNGGPPPSNAVVNEAQALRLAPVFAAGRLLASMVSSMPLQTYRQTGDSHDKLPLPSLFAAPSAQGGLRDWLFRAVTSMVYRGNAVGYITVRNADGYATAAEWLNPDQVAVHDSQPAGPGSFVNPIWYWRGRVVAAENLIHIPWFTLPGRVWGLSPIGAYAATVATGLAAQDFSRDWFSSGGVPPGTFTNSSQVVDQTEATVIKKRLVQAIRSHEPIVYGRDWTYTPITVAASEAKFVDTLRLGATQIASIYGIPPEMIGGEVGGSYSYSSPEQREIELLQSTLMPWMTTLEDAFSALLPRPQYVKFNVDALLRLDAETRFKNYERARAIGLMNIDECRALEDMPPLPNGAGQEYTPLAIKPPTGPAIRRELGRPRLVAGDD